MEAAQAQLAENGFRLVAGGDSCVNCGCVERYRKTSFPEDKCEASRELSHLYDDHIPD